MIWSAVLEKLVIRDHFLPFYPSLNPPTPQNQNFEKMKKLSRMSSFCKCVPKITIIWCVLPEIWCATDNFLSYWLTFLPFGPTLWKKCKKTWTYYHSYARVPKWRSYDVWLLKYKGTTDSLLTFFALLPKKSIFKKMKKNAWRYYHFTQVYQKSWSYAMLYCSWGMTRDRLLFFILSYFFSLLPFCP